MSVSASVTLFGGQNDMNLAKTGNGDSCNVFGGVSKVAAHQLNGTVFYMTVAADQQLSQCNLGALHACCGTGLRGARASRAVDGWGGGHHRPGGGAPTPGSACGDNFISLRHEHDDKLR